MQGNKIQLPSCKATSEIQTLFQENPHSQIFFSKDRCSWICKQDKSCLEQGNPSSQLQQYSRLV